MASAGGSLWEVEGGHLCKAVVLYPLPKFIIMGLLFCVLPFPLLGSCLASTVFLTEPELPKKKHTLASWIIKSCLTVPPLRGRGQLQCAQGSKSPRSMEGN